MLGYRRPQPKSVEDELWDAWLVKRIGLLGGMSWESSAEYYRLINEAARERLGGLHSADRRFPPDADLEAAWERGIQAFTPRR